MKMSKSTKSGNVDLSACQIIERKSPKMLKAFKGVDVVYGAGTVYLTDGQHGVQRLDEYDFSTTKFYNGTDMFMETGVMVALPGDCKSEKAIEQLEMILQCIRAAGNSSSTENS
jgi:hypothetical protein